MSEQIQQTENPEKPKQPLDPAPKSATTALTSKLKRIRPAKEVADPMTDPRLDLLEVPDWLRSMKSIDIMSLPFGEVEYGQDTYDKALIVLYRRGIGFKKLRFLSTLYIAPALWVSPKGKPFKLTKLSLFLKWLFSLTVLIILVLLSSFGAKKMGFGKESLFVSLITSAGLLIVNILVSLEYAKNWRFAYNSFKKGSLPQLFPTTGELNYIAQKKAEKAEKQKQA